MSSCPDCIFEIHQLWQSGFSRGYSNCCCSCLFEHEIIKICQSSHKMCSNNILNFQESTTILNARTKKSGNLLKAPRSLTSLPGPLWPGVVAHDRVLSMGQTELNSILMLNWIVWLDLFWHFAKLFWHLTVCKQKTILLLFWIVWNLIRR